MNLRRNSREFSRGPEDPRQVSQVGSVAYLSSLAGLSTRTGSIRVYDAHPDAAVSTSCLLLHVGDTCTLFLMPASVNTFGYTPLYTFVFSECLICVEHEGIQPSLI